jgi:hypothetical protein
MNRIVFLLLFFSGNCLAQSPELLFVKSLGVSGSNSDVQTAYGIDIDTLGNIYTTVSGGSTFNLGLAQNPNIISSDNNQAAILARFNEDQFDLGGFGYLATDVLRSDKTGLLLTALLDSDSNLSFSELPLQIIEVPENSIRFSLCRYDFEGYPIWIVLGSSLIIDGVATEDLVMACFQGCTNCPFTDGLGEQYQFPGTVQDGVLLALDKNTGGLISSKPLLSTGLAVTESVDHSDELNETSYSVFFTGDLDFQWQGTTPMLAQVEFRTGAVISYNSALESTSLITMNPIGFQPSWNVCRSIRYDKAGNLYCYFVCSQGDYNLKVNGSEYPIDVDSAMDFIILKVDNMKRLCWVKNLGMDGIANTRHLNIDENGFLYLSGSYNEELIIEEDNVSLLAAFSDNAGFLSSFTPEGSTLWCHSVSDQTNSTVFDIVVNSEREMYVSGDFVAFGVDFDFDPNVVVNLGPGNSKDPFIAKYQLPEITPDLFVSKRYEGVGVSEDGATDIIRFRLSRVPESSVSVELIPDAQLNLGNGVGVPIILEFAADESAISEQVVNIAALNDLVVEGIHTGVISISMTSADPAFNNLSENPIAVSIIDNDVMSVEERNEFGFIMSPNPASNFIDIACNQKPEGVSFIEIIDIQGKKVYWQNFVSNTSRIDLSQFSKGTYSVTVRADNQVIWREGVIVR